MAKDKGLANIKLIAQNELSLLYFLFNYLRISISLYLFSMDFTGTIYILDVCAGSVP